MSPDCDGALYLPLIEFAERNNWMANYRFPRDPLDLEEAKKGPLLSDDIT